MIIKKLLRKYYDAGVILLSYAVVFALRGVIPTPVLNFLVFFIYSIVLFRVVVLFFDETATAFRKIILIFCIMLCVHYVLTVHANVSKAKISGTQRKTGAFQKEISPKDKIPFFEKPYFSGGIKVCTRNGFKGKLLNCSVSKDLSMFQCAKTYISTGRDDFSFRVVYYPEKCMGTAKFNLVFQLMDAAGNDVGFVTYVLYGETDHYFHVNNTADGKIFATKIVRPPENVWKTFEVESVAGDYNELAEKFGASLWDKLPTAKVKVSLFSWGDQNGEMLVYLSALEIKEKLVQ